jgi:hypothetical protein
MNSEEYKHLCRNIVDMSIGEIHHPPFEIASLLGVSLDLVDYVLWKEHLRAY